MEVEIKNVLKTIPDTSGIYLFYNKTKELVYVGKATSLKSRVSSYFRGSRSSRPIEQMMHEVVNIKWKITDSALEAAILESIYIKKYFPRYNVDGKDDKSWNYIVITNDEYPQVKTFRQREMQKLQNDKATKQKSYKVTKKQGNELTQSLSLNKKQFLYVFGPYPGLNSAAAMKVLRRMFLFSTCRSFVIPAKAGIQKNKRIDSPDVHRGNDTGVRPCLYRQMGQCLGVCTGEITSKEYRAKVIRPLVTFLSGKKKQVIIDFEKQMKRAAKQEDFETAARLRDQLKQLERIQDIAMINKSFFDDGRQTTDDGRTVGSVVGRLSSVDRVEGYDISNLGSTGKVGSMVVFIDGFPDKKEYRKFTIKTVDGQSDVDCLEEVIRRRLKHGLQSTGNSRRTPTGDERFGKTVDRSLSSVDQHWPMPDLFLIDGGLPQVNKVQSIFDELGVLVPIVGIAKGPARKKNEFVFPKLDKKIMLWVKDNQDILIRVRDEAHRFAITFQRSKRKI